MPQDQMKVCKINHYNQVYTPPDTTMQFINRTFLAQKSSKSGKVVEEQHYNVYMAFLWILCVPLCLFDLARCNCLILKDHMLAIPYNSKFLQQQFFVISVITRSLWKLFNEKFCMNGTTLKVCHQILVSLFKYLESNSLF